MVTVEAVEFNRALCTVFFDSGEKLILSRKYAFQLHLSQGIKLERNELEDTLLKLQYRDALNKAVSMLASRPCSTSEIEKKLLSLHYTVSTTEMVLFKLKKEKLLDDREFGRQWVQSRENAKYGRSRITYELKKKGLIEDDIEYALSFSDSETEMSSAVILAEKAYRKRKMDEDIRKTKQRVMAMLLRKGFDFDTVSSAIRQVEDQIRNE